MLGYISWHQLFVYSCDSCLLSTYLLFSYPSVVCLLLYLVILCLQLSCYYFVHIVYIHELSPSHTHSPGHFLRTLNLYVQTLDALFLLCRCSMRRYASWRVRASPYSISVFLSFLSLYYFLILVISDSFVIPVLYSYDIMCGCLYVLLRWSLTHYSINL